MTACLIFSVTCPKCWKQGYRTYQLFVYNQFDNLLRGIQQYNILPSTLHGIYHRDMLLTLTASDHSTFVSERDLVLLLFRAVAVFNCLSWRFLVRVRVFASVYRNRFPNPSPNLNHNPNLTLTTNLLSEP